LTEFNDWEKWIKMIKIKVLADKIWEFVNSSMSKTSLSTLEQLTILMIKNVNSVKTAISKLNENEKKELKLLCYSYKHDFTVYEWKNAILEALQSFIQEFISHTYLIYMFNSKTLYDMLAALKTHIISTDQAWKMKLINCYQRLKKTLKTQHVKTWLQEWEKMYMKCKIINLSDVKKNQSLFNFLHAVLRIVLKFTNFWMNFIQKKQNTDQFLSDLYKILELFWNNQQLVNAWKSLSQSVFAVFYQEKFIENVNEITAMSNADYKSHDMKLCLCKKKYCFQKCFYIVKSISLSD